jgi:hypothetical protein
MDRKYSFYKEKKSLVGSTPVYVVWPHLDNFFQTNKIPSLGFPSFNLLWFLEVTSKWKFPTDKHVIHSTYLSLDLKRK